MALLTLGPLPVAILLLPIILLLLHGAYTGGPWTDRLFANRAAVLLGEASFPLYMTHMLVIIGGNYWLYLHPAHNRIEIALVALAELLLAVLLGFVCFRSIEEPLRRRLVRLFSAQTVNPEALTPHPSPASPPTPKSPQPSAKYTHPA
jgi:peptidoglycan/LPS O-acetylase OafA/YrhL